uniref:Septin-type G domain-containing protein n=1 Tax=Lepisosteus oculatus TaxID=7918 RepID=W5M4A5_LEPOC
LPSGESGLGKSTLIDSLFLTDLYKERTILQAEGKSSHAVAKRTCACVRETVAAKSACEPTEGFQEEQSREGSWKSIAQYIDQQFEQYFRDESGLNRKNIQDNRVHCVLYFVSPYGHGLRPLDVEFMKAIHEKVNIVPVIAKADTLTPAEVKTMKQRVRDEIEEFGINIYQFPDCDSDEDEEFKQQDLALKESIPFAVIGSTTLLNDSKERPTRGRVYPWGVVEIDNPTHCDFMKLRNMLIQTHMQDLKDVTQEVHYENYRAQCIQSLTRIGAKDRSSRNKISRQSITELSLLPLSETEKLIREKDEELRRMQEMLQKMQQQMQQSQGEQSDT